MKKFTQIKIAGLTALLVFSSFVFANNVDNFLNSKDINCEKLNLSPKAQKKVGGLLLKRTREKRSIVNSMRKGKAVTRKLLDSKNIYGKIDTEIIAVYLTREPNKFFEQKLKSLGVVRKSNIWIPAIGHHRYGFTLFEAPIDKIEILAEMPEIMRVASAERTFGAQLNQAAKRLGMNLFWSNSSYEDYRGNGITIGLIDTGYDVGNTDLPEPIAKWRYFYETYITTNSIVTNVTEGVTNIIVNTSTNTVLEADTNADVSDNISGHGTYVAGCIVGKGILSGDNMQMLGMSTGVQVHVVKASMVNSSGIDVFREDVLVQALSDLAASNCVDMINLSLGTWDAYHDGSSLLEQAIDTLAISNDIPVFCAAGNLGDKKRHIAVEMDKHTEQLIQIKVTTTNQKSRF